MIISMRIWRIRMLHGVNAVKLKGKRIAILAESMYQEMEGRASRPPDQRAGTNSAPTDME